MATYAITLNENTRSGKALMSYLQELGILVKKLTPQKKTKQLREISSRQTCWAHRKI